MDNNFTNLDALRAESQKVQFLGKEFEVGYIPSGLSIPLLETYNKSIEEQKTDESPKKLLEDNVKAVSLFCSFYDNTFTAEYLLKNASNSQIVSMYQIIVTAIIRNLGIVTSDEMASAEKKTIGQIS
ncbi:hypothetical protein [Treponema lecithinolyticum]